MDSNINDLIAGTETEGRMKIDFAKIRQEALIAIRDSSQPSARYNLSADSIRRALVNKDPMSLRKLSEQFYRLSGEYRRLVDYAAGILTFDHLIIPRPELKTKEKAIEKGFETILTYAKNAAIEETGNMIAFAVVKYGVFFGYEMELGNNQISMLPLPHDHCRTRYKVNGVYQVEFDLKYFEGFTRAEDLDAILAGYPAEFEKAYNAYLKDSSLQWIALDPQFARAHMLEEPIPLFSSVFADLLELDEYKNMEKTKQKLSLYTLLVQRIPLNKDNELALYMEEIVDLHTNARGMIKNDAIDVLTTPCEIEAVTLDSGNNSRVERDNIEKATNMVYTSAGTPIALFNAGTSTGSIGLSLSVRVDESLMFPLLKQFERWYQNKFIELSPSVEFGIMFPPITIFNREEKVKEYRESATYGFPTKLLALAAMGVRQYDASFLLDYENNIMDLPNRMVPLSSSHTSSNKEPGAPESEKPLTEEGDKTREKDKNADRAKEE